MLRAIRKELNQRGVNIYTQHRFVGFSAHHTPLISHLGDVAPIEATHYIFCLGGGSWKVTGANTEWLAAFEDIGITTHPLKPSNSGLNIQWPESIRDYHTGKPLKNITIGITNFKTEQIPQVGQTHKVKGEALVTSYGLEGNAIYPISSWVRSTIETGVAPVITIDFKPNLTALDILRKIKSHTPAHYSSILKLEGAPMAIIKAYTSKDEFMNPELFSEKIKCIPLPILSLRNMEESISTVGGIGIENLDEYFALRKYPHLHCIGEMVNWDAPTGGFLLQGCFSMAAFLADKLIHDGLKFTNQQI